MKFLFTGNLYSSIFQQTTILIVCFVFLIILEGASVVRVPHSSSSSWCFSGRQAAFQKQNNKVTLWTVVFVLCKTKVLPPLPSSSSVSFNRISCVFNKWRSRRKRWGGRIFSNILRRQLHRKISYMHLYVCIYVCIYTCLRTVYIYAKCVYAWNCQFCVYFPYLVWMKPNKTNKIHFQNVCEHVCMRVCGSFMYSFCQRVLPMYY